MIGSLPEASDGSLRVETSDTSIDVPLSDVVDLEPMETGFWHRLEGSINLGFSFTEADALTQWSLNANASRRTKQHLFQGSYDSMLSTTGQDEGQTRNAITTMVQRFISRRWFAALLGQGTQNEELGLNLRTVAAAGMGRYILQSNRTELAALLGLSYTREQFVDQGGSNRAELLQGVQWDWFTFADRDIDLSNTIVIFEGNGDPDLRIRLEFDSQMQIKIVKNLHWTFNLFESYDSSPPEGQKKNDLGISTALGWTF
jgi:putative salt-induced outer membrane protein YdiY